MRLVSKIVDRVMIAVVSVIARYAMRVPRVHGDRARLHLGRNVKPNDTLFNLSSGEIFVGDNTIFGHGCMVLTGVHEFVGGMRKKLFHNDPTMEEAPSSGHDIHIGSGCWISSGAIVLAKTRIGDNTIVAAGAVVTKDLPAGVYAAGVPAKVIRRLNEEASTGIVTTWDR